jgi:hypothetical protein
MLCMPPYVTITDHIAPLLAVPPYIDSNNLDLEPEVVRGKYVTLSCPANGIPFPEVEWFKNGRPVRDLRVLAFKYSVCWHSAGFGRALKALRYH